MPKRIPASEPRSFERIKSHYDLEKKLANKLKIATKSDRRHLYTTLYDELFSVVYDHPTPLSTNYIGDRKSFNVLKHFLKPDYTYLEIGPGAGRVLKLVASEVHTAYGVDVSTKIYEKTIFPSNTTIIISDGSSIPLAANTVDFVYSNQLMEHLHPDDAADQLRHIVRVLKPGGAYFCITPNRLLGPHDVSQYFDEVATGFHLKEYTWNELYLLMKKSGFGKCTWICAPKGVFMGKFPIIIPLILEKCIYIFPHKWLLQWFVSRLLTVFLNISIVAYK